MFFIFLFFLPFIHPDSCPIIKCIEETNTFVCFYAKPFESTYIAYLGTCPKDYGCRRGLTSLIKECLPETDYLLEGQSCSYNAECYSQICKDKKCVGLADKEKCSNKSYCSMNNTCQPLKKKGEECDEKDRNPCDFGMMCGKDDPNDCVYYLFVGGEEGKAPGNCICSVNGHSYCEFSSSANETKNLKQEISSTLLNYTKGTVHVAEENFMSSKEFQNDFENFYSGVRHLNQTIVDYIFKGLDNENEFFTLFYSAVIHIVHSSDYLTKICFISSLNLIF